MAKLVIFDIDHTLFKTFARVHVIKDGKRVYTFKSQKDFDNKQLSEEEECDFSEMTSGDFFYNTSKPNEVVISLLKKIIKNNGIPRKETWQVAIVTGRASFATKDKFLLTFEQHGIPISPGRETKYDPSVCHIYRAGDIHKPTPIAKREIVERKIKESPIRYNAIQMYDDSPANLEEFLKIKDPAIKLEPFIVEHGIISDYRQWKRRKNK